jgi:2-dehydropantoate 2-reductase
VLNPAPLSFTVVGAGAIGGTVGAHLAKAGLAVRFVDADTHHLEAMRSLGLRIDAYSGPFVVPVEASSPESVDWPLDVVLLAVKAQHTVPALDGIASRLGTGSTVVSLQNGLNEPVIAAAVGADRTLGAMVNFAADIVEPGVIKFYAPGALKLGRLNGETDPRLERIAAELNRGFPVEVTDNIWGYLWTKVGGLGMIIATAASGEQPADAIDRYRRLMVEVMSEIHEVALLEGVRLCHFDGYAPNLYVPREQRDWARINVSLDDYIAIARAGQKKSGIWRDMAVRHRPTEVEGLLGEAVRIGERLGKRQPLIRALMGMIRQIESGERTMSYANLDELEVLRRVEYTG